MRVVHFLHIGKTGGTAIRHALSAHLQTRDWRIILHHHPTHLEHIPPGESVFFFLRDPVARFVSGFYSRQRQGLPRHNLPWSDEEAKAYSLFATADSLAVAFTAPDNSRRSAAVAAANSLLHLRDSYWKWLRSEDYLKQRVDDILFIGRQESLPTDFECLKGLLGLGSEVQLPQDDLNAHRNPPHCDYRLSATAIDNLKKWYEPDFHCLEVCERLRCQISDRRLCPGGP